MAIAPYLSQQPVDDFGLRFSELKYNATLAVSTDTVLTVPGNAPRYKAVIKVSGVCWVALNSPAVIPVNASLNQAISELVTPEQMICREVKAGDILHFISASASAVSVVLYALNTNN